MLLLLSIGLSSCYHSGGSHPCDDAPIGEFLVEDYQISPIQNDMVFRREIGEVVDTVVLHYDVIDTFMKYDTDWCNPPSCVCYYEYLETMLTDKTKSLECIIRKTTLMQRQQEVELTYVDAEGNQKGYLNLVGSYNLNEETLRYTLDANWRNESYILHRDSGLIYMALADGYKLERIK